MFVTVVTKGGGVVNSIITVIMFDSDSAEVPHHFLEACLPQYSLACSHVTLEGNENVSGGTVDVDSATIIPILSTLTSVPG